LGLDSLSQFDHFGRPLRGIFSSEPDLTPYAVIPERVDINEKNPPAPEHHASLDFSRPDAVDDETLNRILWQAIKGDVPFPGVTRAPTAIGNLAQPRGRSSICDAASSTAAA
ncbi:MAG: hypothetical protein DMF59_20440, partial [Acidobacteria bacterium]